MKKGVLPLIIASCGFFVGHLSAQTNSVNSTGNTKDITVLKRANPDYKEQGDTGTSGQFITTEKTKNPNEQKEDVTKKDEKILVTEKKLKNPK